MYERVSKLSSLTGILSDSKLSTDVTGRKFIELLFGLKYSSGKIFTIEYSWPTLNNRIDDFFLSQIQKIVPGCGLDVLCDYGFIKERISTWEALNKAPVIWMQEAVKFSKSWYIKPKDKYIEYIKFPWQEKKLPINGASKAIGLQKYFSNLQAIGSSAPEPKELVVDILMKKWGSAGSKWPKYIMNRYELLAEVYGQSKTLLEISGLYKAQFLKEMEELVL